jgi:fibronectin-binding autotransporter adhesin
VVNSISVSIMKYYCSILLALFAFPSAAQVISNNGAVVNVTATGIISGGSISGVSGTITNAGTMAVTNVTLQSGATITNSNVLKIAGSISNSGTFTSTAGSIEMNGSSAQSIPAAAFATNTVKTLTTNNSAGVSLSGTLKISDYLKASAGAFATGTYLTLLSTASQTAYVDGSGNGSVLGTVTMQRYLPSGFGYRYISSPFQAATVAELANDVNLTDTFVMLWKHDENVAHAGWTKYTNTASTLTPLAGYAANFGALTSPKTIDISGVVNNGTLNTTLYNHNQVYTLGFNLVGNPYPSPIDWNAVTGWTKTNIDNAIYYFDNGVASRYQGTYSSYINGVSSNGIASNIISSMQGFFVHVSNGSFPVTASLSINNNARVASLATVYHRQAGTSDQPLIRISAGYENADSLSDPAVVYFEDGASDLFEQDLDALKLLNTDERVPNLYIQSEERKLAINAISQPIDGTGAVPLRLETNREGGIVFTARDIENMPPGLHVYFADAETGIIQDLEQVPVYRQELGKGNYSNRFYLLFSRETHLSIPGSDPLIVFAKGGSLFVNMTADKGELLVSNTLGQVMNHTTLEGKGMHEITLVQGASGIYVVSLSTAKGKQSGKVFLTGQ